MSPQASHSPPAPVSGAALSEQELRRFSPLDGLMPESLEEIRAQAQVGTVYGGHRLFSEGVMDRWSYFLLEGEVLLTGGGRPDRRVVAGSPDARWALAPAVPRERSAVAQGAARYLRVDRNLLEVHSGGRTGGEAYAVDELDIESSSPLETSLLALIYGEYVEDRLDLPGLPEIAVRIRRAVADPNVTAQQVGRLIQADPALVARVLRVANSALYGGTAPVRHLREAIVRLGLGVTRDLVTSFTLQNLFETHNSLLKRRLVEVWQHSTLVAAIAFVLARHARHCDPEQALLAGLLHDIGAAILITHSDAYPELVRRPEDLDPVLERLRGEVGALVLARWGFPGEIATVAREAGDWWRDPGPKADLCDLVVLARLHAYAGESEGADLPEMDRLPAYRKLDLGPLSEARTLAILEQAQREIAEMRRLLSG